MNMERIKIAQIGIEHLHAGGFMGTIRKYPDIFEVLGIAEENPLNIKKYGSAGCYSGIPFMSINELLEIPGLQAVMIETEDSQLLGNAMKVVQRGLHVHIDKPVGTNLFEFRSLLREAKAKKLIVNVGYMYRYNPAVDFCLKMARGGNLGVIYEVDAIMNTRHTTEYRNRMKQYPGGNMFILGSHMVDLVVLLQGMPEKIIPMNKKTGFDGIDAVDHAFAVFEYANGISTVCATCNEVNGYGRRQLVVCGREGTIEIKPLEGPYNGDPAATLATSAASLISDYSDCKMPIPLRSMAGRYDAMMLNFAEMVLGKKENPFSYEHEYAVLKALLASCGMPVDLHNDDLWT